MQSFPLRTQQWTADISGTSTDFIASLYADRLMVVATQVGALGTIQSARYAPFGLYNPELANTPAWAPCESQCWLFVVNAASKYMLRIGLPLSLHARAACLTLEDADVGVSSFQTFLSFQQSTASAHHADRYLRSISILSEDPSVFFRS